MLLADLEGNFIKVDLNQAFSVLSIWAFIFVTFLCLLIIGGWILDKDGQWSKNILWFYDSHIRIKAIPLCYPVPSPTAHTLRQNQTESDTWYICDSSQIQYLQRKDLKSIMYMKVSNYNPLVFSWSKEAKVPLSALILYPIDLFLREAPKCIFKK